LTLHTDTLEVKTTKEKGKKVTITRNIKILIDSI